MSDNATVGYGGQRGVVNATILPAEMQIAQAADKKKLAEHVAANQEYKRIKRGKRVLTHAISEEIHTPTGPENQKLKIKTTRTNR